MICSRFAALILFATCQTRKIQHKHKLFGPDFPRTCLTLTPLCPGVKKFLPITGAAGKPTFGGGRPRFSTRTSMTRRVLETFCTKKVCVDFGTDIPRTSGGHSRGYPGPRLRSRQSKSWKNKHFGADIHDPKARTSTTLRDFQKLRSEKLWAEFSFPTKSPKQSRKRVKNSLLFNLGS